MEGWGGGFVVELALFTLHGQRAQAPDNARVPNGLDLDDAMTSGNTIKGREEVVEQRHGAIRRHRGDERRPADYIREKDGDVRQRLGEGAVREHLLEDARRDHGEEQIVVVALLQQIKKDGHGDERRRDDARGVDAGPPRGRPAAWLLQR